MSGVRVFEDDVLLGPFDPRRAERTRLARLTTVVGCGVAAYSAAVVLDAGSVAINLSFVLALTALPPLAWWAVARVSPELRTLFALLGTASTLWLGGTVMWYAYYADAGDRIPTPPGPWDVLFFSAYALALGSLWFAPRSAVSLRRTALDASLILAAGLALGATIVGHGLAHGVSAASLVTLIRPLFGVATLTLIASALLGRWEGLPRSIALVGLGQLFLTVGSFVYSVRSISGDFVADDRWADLPWFAGVSASILAALVVVLRLDRPLTFGRPAAPAASGRSGAGMVASLCALAVVVGASLEAIWTHRTIVLVVDLAAVGWAGVAMTLRSWGAIRELERAYERLDRAHVELEHANDRLLETNDRLAAANVEIRSVHGAFEEVLVLVDERTDGGLRNLIEESGEDLARFLTRYRRRTR